MTIAQAKHKLLCTCGIEHLVQPQDAGQRLSCSCGASLEVPTLRYLRQLPVAELERDRANGTAKRRPWTFQQGLLFNTGLVVLALALFTLFYLGQKRANLRLDQPVFPYQEYVAREIAHWDIAELWRFWSANRDFQLDARPTPQYLLARQTAKRLDRFLAVATGFGVVGLITMLAAAMYRSGSRR